MKYELSRNILIAPTRIKQWALNTNAYFARNPQSLTIDSDHPILREALIKSFATTYPNQASTRKVGTSKMSRIIAGRLIEDGRVAPSLSPRLVGE
ncbi:hypothetical protein SAMN06265222_12924 [Neorhodopirellula lusitana]|uniref:Uncharacterized protein n=1 Tax=Neorhodopirellula lusitana TaxID=445327 RepID=A0ABY1QU49_9BACT|nr:hypothetical protein SAMN06265222_12924 [Neorhodopirellula lusitana]